MHCCGRIDGEGALCCRDDALRSHYRHDDLVRLQVGINGGISCTRFLRRRGRRSWYRDGEGSESGVGLGLWCFPNDDGGNQKEYDKVEQNGADKVSYSNQFCVPVWCGARRVSLLARPFFRRIEFGRFQGSLRKLVASSESCAFIIRLQRVEHQTAEIFRPRWPRSFFQSADWEFTGSPTIGVPSVFLRSLFM